MDSLETALRAALSKGDIDDPEYRRKVYESAANAMHRTLAAKGDVPQKAFDDQRLRLADAIRTIEADIKPQPRPIAPAAPPPPPPPSTPQADSSAVRPEVPPVEQDRVEPSAEEIPLRSNRAMRQEPVFDPPPETPAPSVEPQLEPELTAPRRPDASELPPQPEAVRAKKPKAAKAKAKRVKEDKTLKRAPFARMLTGAVALAMLGIGLIWVITTGAFQSAEERDTAVRTAPQPLESEDFAGRDPGTSSAPQTLQTLQQASGDWITLFSPANPTGLTLVGGAAASVEDSPFGAYARLTTPSDAAEVEIDIPLNVLQSSIGRTIQLSLQAQSEDGAPTQMSVTCDLGALAECRRVRYNVAQGTSEYLLQIPVGQNARVDGVGKIKLKTDVENGSRVIKLYNARARILESG